MNDLSILYEDNHLLVVNKPAGIATMGAESGETLHSLAAQYIKHAYNKPGNVFVGIVSRLDAMTSGVIVLARTSKAASRLAPQFSGEAGKGPKATKTYLAVVDGHLDATTGILSDDVLKDDNAKRMRVVSPGSSGARNARLRYHVIGRDDHHTMVAVRLETGRKHQIRLQFAHRGHAVLGDRKYGSDQRFASGSIKDGIALHSYQLQLKHPTLSDRMNWKVAPPKTWKSALQRLGITGKLAECIAKIDWQGSEPQTDLKT